MTQFTLRPYQQDAVSATFDFLDSRDGHGLIVVPTGGGKSPIMGALIREARRRGGRDARCLVLAHRKELVQQDYNAVVRSGTPMFDVGIYSASAGRKDRTQPVIVAQIQSLARRPNACGGFTHVFIDEAHLISPEEDALWRKTLDAQKNWQGDVRFIGLTATPYRMGTGYLHEGDGAVFSEIIYEASVTELIRDGYLCPLISRATATTLSTEGVRTRGGEWIAGELERAVDKEALNAAIADELTTRLADRHHWIVFCAGVQHAEHMAQALRARGVAAAAVTGTTPAEERARILSDFDRGRIRALLNVDVLSTGFDQPQVDAIALLRPTRSTGLYVQCVGRGFRLDPSKENTLVLDFAQNVARHGPVDAVRVKEAGGGGEDGEAPAKACPGCMAYVATAVRVCPECGHEFPSPDRLKEVKERPDERPILSTEVREPDWWEVTNVHYAVHVKSYDPDAPPTLRVEYYAGMRRVAQEWICIEHTGYARTKAEKWWRRRTEQPCPTSVDDAWEIATSGALLTPTEIATRPEGRYTRIVDYRLPDPTWSLFPPLPPIGSPVSSTLPRACWTCAHYRDAYDICALAEATPPPEVLRSGCEMHQPMSEAQELAGVLAGDEGDGVPF